MVEGLVAEIIIGLLILSLSLNIWFIRKLWDNQADLGDELKNQQNTLHQFKAEVIKNYMTKEEFNRHYNMISEKIKENNHELSKKFDHLEDSINRSIKHIEDNMLTKDQFYAEKQIFKKKTNDNNGKEDGS